MPAARTDRCLLTDGGLPPRPASGARHRYPVASARLPAASTSTR